MKWVCLCTHTAQFTIFVFHVNWTFSKHNLSLTFVFLIHSFMGLIFLKIKKNGPHWLAISISTCQVYTFHFFINRQIKISTLTIKVLFLNKSSFFNFLLSKEFTKLILIPFVNSFLKFCIVQSIWDISVSLSWKLL